MRKDLTTATIMANIQLTRCYVFILVVMRVSYSDESCGDVKITSPKGNIFSVSLNDWLNMTFQLKSDNCSSTYLITFERKEQDRPMIICRIHHNQNSCFKTGTESNYSCRCVSPSGPVEFWEKLVRPGDVEYRFRWTNISSGKYEEKKISYHVATGDEKNGEHLQTMIFILCGAGSLLLVVAVVFISRRCHKSTPSGGDVKITSPKGNTFNVSLNDWLNMTFQLKSDNCLSTYLITVERKEQDRPMLICRIHHNQTSCFKTRTESNYSCRCVSPSGPVEFWEKLVRPGDVEYRWRWTDVSSGLQGENKIYYHVTSLDWEDLTTSSSYEDVNTSQGCLKVRFLSVTRTMSIP